MRIRIDGPCFIESDQPFIITPIYVSEKETPTPPPAPVETHSDVPTMPGVQKKRRKRGHKRTCVGCGATYISTRGLFHDAKCKVAFYDLNEVQMRLDGQWPATSADPDYLLSLPKVA